MKKITISLLLFLFTPFSFAASYPSSCPAEAKAIVEAVGGCSAVNKNQYPSVYEKCCALPAPVTPKPMPVKPLPPVIPTPVPSPKLEYSEPLKDLPRVEPATLTPEAISPPVVKKKPLQVFKEIFQRGFNRFLRFFRFR